jgi:hypothetical protein
MSETNQTPNNNTSRTYRHPPLPEELKPWKITAPQVGKGGEKTDITLIRYPILEVRAGEVEFDVVTMWLDWWKSTQWATDPANNNKIRWDSTVRSAWVWSHFWEGIHYPTGHPYIYCRNCGLALQHPAVKTIGTKHMLNHVKSQSCQRVPQPKHSLPFGDRPTIPQKRSAPATIPQYTPALFEKEIVRVVIDNNWSFRTVERPSFQRFIQFLQPNAVIISCYKFRGMFIEQFKAAKSSLLQDLGGTTKISLALDGWSANNHLSFLAVKGYYIDDNWQTQERLLDFIPIRGRHTGASMATEVLRLLSDTKTKDRLLAITCDNASNNNTLATAMHARLQEEGINWDPQENTVPCLAHIINLVVQDIIQHLKLEASDEMETGHTLQRHHIEGIQAQISVPNSLRKVRSLLLQTFITD